MSWLSGLFCHIGWSAWDHFTVHETGIHGITQLKKRNSSQPALKAKASRILEEIWKTPWTVVNFSQHDWYTCERSRGNACFLISLLQGTFPVHQSLLRVEIVGKVTSIEMKSDWSVIGGKACKWMTPAIIVPKFTECLGYAWMIHCQNAAVLAMLQQVATDLNPKSSNAGPWSPLDQTSSLHHSLDLTKSFNFSRPWMALAMLHQCMC